MQPGYWFVPPPKKKIFVSYYITLNLTLFIFIIFLISTNTCTVSAENIHLNYYFNDVQIFQKGYKRSYFSYIRL